MAAAREPIPDIASRTRSVAAAVHSAELEGGSPSTELSAHLREYEAGRIDSDELVRRTRGRYESG